MNVLVTGGAGFIGSHLIDRLLDKGNIVTCIDNFSLGKNEFLIEASKNKAFTLYNIDLINLDGIKRIFKLNKFDIIYHLAANSDIQLGFSDTNIDFNNTFMSTINILECMKSNNIKKIVFASSSAIYGNYSGKISENSGPLLPISNYGAAKLSSESFISSFCECYNINAWIIRFPNVVGWRLTHGVIFDFINKLLNNPSKLVILGDGAQTKPYLYISDLLDAFDVIINKNASKVQLFNVSSDSSSNVNFIADTVINELNLKNVKITYTGGNVGWIGDVAKFSYDISKIKKLGWFSAYKSDEAIQLSVKKEISFRCL